MFYVYMLKSKSIKSITYVGYTNDLNKRIKLHNTGKGAKFTKGENGFNLQRKIQNKKEAILRKYYKKKNKKLKNKIKNENFNITSL